MPTSETDQPLSAVLGDLCDQSDSHITVGDLTLRFGGRAMGALLFVFGLLCALPFLPPGSTTVFGLPLVLLAPQLLFGARAPWLPVKVGQRRISVQALRPGLRRAIPWLRRVEAVSRPRWGVLFGPLGRRAIGLVCTVLALVLILPIPLGNILPGAAVAVLSLSLVQRDGALALLGYALSLASGGVLIVAAHLVIKALQHFATSLMLA